MRADTSEIDFEILPNNRQIFSFFKRITDIIISTLSLIILSPFMFVIAAFIKLDSPGPVFFRQTRTGRNGKTFRIYKFRTMVADNDFRNLATQDQRTKLGKVLRLTSVDEIPQLINILKGEMSFIGPRPWVVDYYNAMNTHERARVLVRPGVTGLAQVSGRNNLTIFEKIDCDLEYVKNYSLKEDLKILYRTFKTVAGHSGADAGKYTISKEINDLRKSNKATV